MKIECRKPAAALYVYFKPVEVAKSREVKEGVVIDFDTQGYPMLGNREFL